MSAPGDNPESKSKLSALAVASTILGLLGLLTLWIVGGLILAGAGAVLGHLAIHDIRFSKGKHTGKRIARVGIALSYFAMLIFPLYAAGVLLTVPKVKDFQKSQLSALSEKSKANASLLFRACEQYSRANGGRYPKQWSDLAGPYLSEIEIENLLISPHPGSTGEAFEIISHERPVLPEVASSVVVIQENAPSTVDKVAIVYANGKIDLIENPNRD
jgi:hypothetical protein